MVERKESGNYLPESRSGLSTEDPSKISCGVLTYESKSCEGYFTSYQS